MAFNLGEGIITFRGNIQPLQKATADAKKLLDDLAAHSRKALSAGDPFGMMKRGARGANTAIAGVNARLVLMRARLVAATRAAQALAKALGAVNSAGGGPTGKGIGAAAAGIGQGISNALQGLGKGIKSVLDGVGKGIAEPIMRGMAAPIRAIGQSLGSAASGFGKGIKSALQGGAAVIRSFGGMFKSALQGGAAVIRSFGGMFKSVARGFATALRAAVNSVKSVIRTVTAPLRAIGGSLGSFGGGIGGGMGFVAGAAGALTAGVGGALSAEFIKDITVNTEAGLNQVRRSLETTEAEFEKFGRDIRELGAASASVKFEDILDIAGMAAKMGIEGGELSLFTSDVVKMRQVMTDIPVEELTARLAGLLTVFKKGTEDTLSMASAVNRLDLMSTASARNILDVSNRMSGTAAFLGMSPQKTLAISATLLQAKVPVETAGTAMSQIMGRMQTRKDRREFAKVAGMGSEQFQSLSASDPLGALKAVATGLKGMKPQEALEALERLKLDGQRARQVLLALAQSMGTLDRFVKASDEDWNDNSSILGAVARNAATADGMIEKLWNNVKLAAEALGKSLLPVLKGVVAGITDLANDIRKYFDENGGVIAAWAEAVGEKIAHVGVLFREWKTIFGGIGDLFTRDGEKVKGFGLVAIFLREKWEQFAVVMQRLFGYIGKDGLLHSGAIKKALTAGFDVAFSAIKNMAIGLAKFLSNLFTQLAPNLGLSLMKSVVGDRDAGAAGGAAAAARRIALGQKEDPGNPGMLPDWALKKFGIDVKRIRGAQFKDIKPDTKPLDEAKDAIKADVAGINNPFKGLLGNLPNRQDQINALMGVIAEARRLQVQENQATAALAKAKEDEARRMLRVMHAPQPVVTGFENLPKGRGERERELKRRRARAARDAKAKARSKSLANSPAGQKDAAARIAKFLGFSPPKNDLQDRLKTKAAMARAAAPGAIPGMGFAEDAREATKEGNGLIGKLVTLQEKANQLQEKVVERLGGAVARWAK